MNLDSAEPVFLPVTVMDFTGVYERESFCRNPRFHWIDCRDVHGTRGYCDADARRILEARLRPFPAEGIHFIDSGNYHYVSEFWLEKLTEPFNLAVFDHHTDMKKPLFGDLLSCGGWIGDALARAPRLNRVLLIGISPEQEKSLAASPFRNRFYCYSADAARRADFPDELLRIHERFPLYFSIDKDVLNPEVVRTDWDQGELTSSELKQLLRQLIRTHRVLGVDVCGECARSVGEWLELESDDDFNSRLLEFLEREHQLKTAFPAE